MCRWMNMKIFGFCCYEKGETSMRKLMTDYGALFKQEKRDTPLEHWLDKFALRDQFDSISIALFPLIEKIKLFPRE